MKRVFIIFGFILLLFLCSCNSPFPLIRSKLDDCIKTVATDGTEFTIRRIEEEVPDQEITIVVGVDNQDVFCCYDISNHLNEYDYSNDLVNKFGEIINEYYQENVKVYQFNWGIVYTLDEGVTFSCLAKHNYNGWEFDDEVGQIISKLK